MNTNQWTESLGECVAGVAVSVVPLLGVPIDLIYGNCNLSDNWFPWHRSRGFRRERVQCGSKLIPPSTPCQWNVTGVLESSLAIITIRTEEEEGDPLTINDLRLWVFLLCFTHQPTEAFHTINCHMPPTHQEGTDRRPAAEEAVASVATRPRQQFHWKSSPRRHPVGHPRPPTGQQIRRGSRVHWQSA